MVSSTVTVLFVETDSAVAAGMYNLLAARLSGPCTHSLRVICAGATPLASSRGEDARERRRGALKRITKKERVHSQSTGGLPPRLYEDSTESTAVYQSTSPPRSPPSTESTRSLPASTGWTVDSSPLSAAGMYICQHWTSSDGVRERANVDA